MKGWYWITMAGIFESLWNITLKKSSGIYDWGVNIIALFFLWGAIITFKKGIDLMPLSIAVVIWSGISILLTILLDIAILKSRIDLKTSFFMVMCIISIIGMNYYSSN
ncbi:MAG: DMT family transporter [Sphingobacteriales bacterium]